MTPFLINEGVIMKKTYVVCFIALSAALLNGCSNDSSSDELCTAGQTKCVDDSTIAKCSEDGQWINESCEFSCDADTGSCIYPDSCNTGDVKCANDVLSTCQGGAWKDEKCEFGCDAKAKKCMECKAGQTKCADNVFSVCTDGFWKTETCPTGCNTETGRCNEGDKKCEPAELKCSEDGTNLQECNEEGVWQEKETCSYGCDAEQKACNPRCREDALQCDGEDGLTGQNVVICHGEQWEISEECELGCVAGECSSACGNEDEYRCSADALMVCHGNWELAQECPNGCDNGKCKDCVTVDEKSCNESGNVQICKSDFTLEETETCALGCDNGKCKDCVTADEKSCTEAGNVQTCQSDFTLEETETCALGCDNGKCKDCVTVDEKSCNEAGNVQFCKSDFSLEETEKCKLGCNQGGCNECKDVTHCSGAPGWKTGSCTSSNTCKATSCLNTYSLQDGTCTLEIPFSGNVFVTEMENNADIIAKASTILYDNADTPTKYVSWKNPKETLSFFFAPKSTGTMKLFVEASVPKGTKQGTLSFTYEGVSHEITVDSATAKIYPVGSWKVEKSGYVKIEMRGTSVTPSGSEFARVSDFFVGGDVASAMPACTPKSVVKDSYWNRRGPSVHMTYTLPNEDVEWFYNEVIVPKGSDIINSYFMLTGFSEGYMGIQANSATERKVLFSVWSAYSTDDPNQIPADYKVTTLRKGKGVEPQPFGNEGSGMQSFYTYPWETEKNYKTLVHVKPTGNGSTDYTGYFCDEKGNWHLLASFRRPKTNTWYKGAHSFLENYNPASSIYSREVHFINPWVRTKSGKWVELTEAKYSADTAGTKGYRIDREGFANGSSFVLRNCGFVVGSTALGEKFKRSSSGTPAPDIDFAALEKL